MPIQSLPFLPRNTVLTTGLLLAAALSACSNEKAETAENAQTGKTTNEAVVATINGKAITERELAFAETDLASQFAQAPAEQKRAMILNALIDIKSLEAAAIDAGLDKDSNFNAQMAFVRARALHNTFFQEKALNVITDEEIKARYDTEISALKPEKEVSARHILVEKEEEAKAIIAELDGGADFIELAKERSTGPSGPNGGALGFFGPGQMVPEFEAAAFALDKGVYTKEPVKSQFGWHIIKKDDERDRKPPALDEVKDQIRQAIAREKYFALTQEAREKYGVEIVDEDLKAKLEKLK